MKKFVSFEQFLSALIVCLFFIFAAAYSSYQEQNAGNKKALPDFQKEASYDKPPLTGKELYMKACSNCHGVNGKGASADQLKLQTPPPDFTNCSFASREPDGDWIAIAHQGGPARAFSREMPAFGEALTEDQLQKIMDHIRTFCKNDNWPRGELNLPRPLVTEKAYPEDEAVLTTTFDLEGEGAVNNEIVYEHRFGSRNQLEIVFPFGYRQQASGNWTGGNIGDMALGVKRVIYHNLNSGSIFSLTGEVIIPTGDEDVGFGSGTTILEPFATFGQILPYGGFLHIQTGVEYPLLRDKAQDEAFWRAALGKSIAQNRWGRTWSPMVEILGSRELESGAITRWDIAPQFQVTLNTRQNIMLNVGMRIPADDPDRDSQFMVYILWDWFDGGLLEGW